MITDAGFESEANRQKAREKNINLVSTDLKGKIPDQAVADFEVENGIVVKCPKGYAPIKSKAYKNGQIRSTFDRSKCENCPFKDKCKAKIHKKTAVVMLSKTTVSRARIARAMGTDEYRKLQKMCAMPLKAFHPYSEESSMSTEYQLEAFVPHACISISRSWHTM